MGSDYFVVGVEYARSRVSTIRALFSEMETTENIPHELVNTIGDRLVNEGLLQYNSLGDVERIQFVAGVHALVIAEALTYPMTRGQWLIEKSIREITIDIKRHKGKKNISRDKNIPVEISTPDGLIQMLTRSGKAPLDYNVLNLLTFEDVFIDSANSPEFADYEWSGLEGLYVIGSYDYLNEAQVGNIDYPFWLMVFAYNAPQEVAMENGVIDFVRQL